MVVRYRDAALLLRRLLLLLRSSRRRDGISKYPPLSVRWLCCSVSAVLRDLGGNWTSEKEPNFVVLFYKVVVADLQSSAVLNLTPKSFESSAELLPNIETWPRRLPYRAEVRKITVHI